MRWWGPARPCSAGPTAGSPSLDWLKFKKETTKNSIGEIWRTNKNHAYVNVSKCKVKRVKNVFFVALKRVVNKCIIFWVGGEGVQILEGKKLDALKPEKPARTICCFFLRLLRTEPVPVPPFHEETKSWNYYLEPLKQLRKWDTLENRQGFELGPAVPYCVRLWTRKENSLPPSRMMDMVATTISWSSVIFSSVREQTAATRKYWRKKIWATIFKERGIGFLD